MTDKHGKTLRNKSRVYLLAIIALFIVPLLAAWLLIDVWRPAGSVHHGELLNPARPIEHLQIVQKDQQTLDIDSLKKRWTLAYIANDSVCDDACRIQLYRMRQLRLGLGKDIGRMQTLLMMQDAPDQDLRQWLEQEHELMLKGVADAETIGFFTQAFAQSENRNGPWIYLIDPLGNLVMRYGVDVDPGGIRKDIKRLFKYSQIG